MIFFILSLLSVLLIAPEMGCRKLEKRLVANFSEDPQPDVSNFPVIVV